MFSLRRKMIFITCAVSVVLAFLIGFSIFLEAYSLFFKNFAGDKLSLARSIAAVIDGGKIQNFTDPESMKNADYQQYLDYLHIIKNDNPDISYLYIVVYDPERRYHLYTLDANINEENTLWLETDAFALICRIKENGEIIIEYDQREYSEDFSFKADKQEYNVTFQEGKEGKEIQINGEKLFALRSLDPLIVETSSAVLSGESGIGGRKGEGIIGTGGITLDTFYTLSLKGQPESIPGEPYNQYDEESIIEINRILEEGNDYVSEEFEESDFGDALFIYVPIEDTAGKHAAVLCLEVWAREAQEFRRSIFLAAGLVTIVAFLLSVFIYIIVIEKLVVKSIKELSKGIGEISKGNLDFHVIIDRNDEIGQLADTFNSMADGLKEKEMIKDLFGKYVQKEVAETAIKSGIQLGGEKQEATVLFSDIRSFTSLSEQLTPGDLVALLNRYFTLMVENIAANHGVLDKYIGDALMVHFGILGDKKRPADRAVKAAVEMALALNGFNTDQRSREEPEVRTGIGIHTGELVAGNIGAPNRMEFTVIGDSVNLASRVEGLTKLFGAKIMITELTLEALEERKDFSIRPLAPIVVKGKSRPVQMYEVFDADEEIIKQRKILVAREIDEGLSLYRTKKFTEAKHFFKQLLQTYGEDRLLQFYIDQSDHYSKHPPSGIWDGSVVMDRK